MIRPNYFLIFSCIAKLCLTTFTRAALIGVATKVKDPAAGNNFLAPEAALSAGWVAYQLSLQATAGELIGAVDVSITGNVLHQRWTDADFDGTTNPSPNGIASDGRGDSHLTAPASSPFGVGPFETNSKSGSPLTSTPGTIEYGLGDLSGAWAILAPSTSANLAYLVFKSSDIPKLQITVKAADPSGDVFPMLTNLDFGPPYCLDCSPPVISDETIDNVDANNPGSLHHQIAVSAPSSFINLSNLSLQSYTPPSGMSGNGPASSPVLAQGGYVNNEFQWYFDWNTVGSPLGTYVWSFHASNNSGMDDGTLTVNITSAVPEPTSPVLIFVAVSTAALFRRW